MWIMLLLAALWSASPEELIRAELARQQQAWNRGDIRSFMQGYIESPDTLFVGKAVTRGHANVQQRYLKAYPNRDAMGTLIFSEIEVKMLGAEYAAVLGRFTLKRSQAGGGDAAGLFTLIFQRAPQGWKIILDHTS